VTGLATYGGWANRLDDACPWRLRSGSMRSAD
jgi:hypothetical protein